MGTEPKVKGVMFRSALRSLETLRGAETVERSIAAMPADVGGALRHGGLVPGSWYPISWCRGMWSGILQGTGEGREIVRAVGAQAIDQDLKGVYRYVLRLLSPETIASVSPRLFSNYYDTGSVEVTTRKGFTRAHYVGCRGFDENMWNDIAASSQRVLELAGASNVRIHLRRGGGDGDDECELETYWV